MTDEQTRPDQLAEQTWQPGQSDTLPDLPDSAYPDDATPLDPVDQARDAGDQDPDSLAGDFTDPDVDVDALVGEPADDQEATDE